MGYEGAGSDGGEDVLGVEDEVGSEGAEVEVGKGTEAGVLAVVVVVLVVD